MARANSRLLVPFLLLASLGAFSSCVEENTTLGSAYIPQNQFINLAQTEFDLPVGINYPDSLNTEMSDYLQLGSISTEEYGNVTVGAAVSIVPSCTFKEWGEDPVFKEMTLSLCMSSLQTLDESQMYIPQNIYVHRMKRDLDSTTLYGNSIKPGDYTEEQCCIGVNVTTGLDTVLISFPEEFARPIFAMDSMTLDSVQLFCKQFKGLYINTDKRGSKDIGGRISEFGVSNASPLELVYTSTRKDGYRRDTSELFWLVGYGAYSIMTIDRDSLIAKCEKAESVIKTDGIAGATPFVNGRKLRAQLDKWLEASGLDRKNIMISKAVLDFPITYSGHHSDYNAYPGNLFPCCRMRDSIGDVIYMPINEIYTAEYSQGYLLTNIDDGNKCYYYRPDAALYIQSLLKEDLDKVDDTYDIWMMPTSTYTITKRKNSSAINDYYNYYYYSYYGIDLNSTTQTLYSCDNTTYYQGTLNGTGAKNHPKLRITYTVSGN